MYHVMNHGLMGIGWLFWIIILGALVLLIVKAAFPKNNTEILNGNGDTALNVLKTRYAKGEISKSEYEKVKSDLIN